MVSTKSFLRALGALLVVLPLAVGCGFDLQYGDAPRYYEVENRQRQELNVKADFDLGWQPACSRAYYFEVAGLWPETITFTFTDRRGQTVYSVSSAFEKVGDRRFVTAKAVVPGDCPSITDPGFHLEDPSPTRTPTPPSTPR